MPTINCPHCFKPFEKMEMLFRCSNSDCVLGEDVALGDHLGEKQAYRNRSFKPTKEEVENGNALCRREDGGCNKTTAIHLCPSCHSEIPQWPWKNQNFVVSVVGSTFSGKSCFLAIMINQVFKEFMGAMGGNTFINFSTEDGGNLYSDNYLGPIIKDHKPPESTGVTRINPDVRRPFIFALNTWRYRRYFRPLKRKIKTNLVVYDTPGEDYNSERDAHALKSIANSNGLVFVVDFATFPGVADLLGVKRGTSQTPESILKTFYNVFCKQRPDMTIGSKIKVPAAIVLSKLDLIQPKFPDLKAIEAVTHEGGVDMENLHQVSGEVRDLMINSLGGSALNDTIESYFENFMYFAISSGHEVDNPDNPGDEEDRLFYGKPHRIIDPLVWVMHQGNLISSK